MLPARARFPSEKTQLTLRADVPEREVSPSAVFQEVSKDADHCGRGRRPVFARRFAGAQLSEAGQPAQRHSPELRHCHCGGGHVPGHRDQGHRPLRRRKHLLLRHGGGHSVRPRRIRADCDSRRAGGRRPAWPDLRLPRGLSERARLRVHAGHRPDHPGRGLSLQQRKFLRKLPGRVQVHRQRIAAGHSDF